MVLPIAAGDTGGSVYGLAPFGIHFGGGGPGGHAFDGHPGWDVEYRIGASVLAAADGVVQSIVADIQTSGRSTVQIQHQVSGGNYRTVYTNIENVAGGISPGATVTRGQPIGRAGTQSQFIGSQSYTWAMTHFQVDDFSQNQGSTNPNAVNPESFLDASGRDLLDRLWRAAAYGEELTEPFTGNPRDVAFPLTRTWTRESGSLDERLDLTRSSAVSSEYTYVFSNPGSGGAPERGSVTFTPAQSMSTIDLEPQGGTIRRGVIDIVGDTMRISLAPAGAARPASLSGATVYRTMR